MNSVRRKQIVDGAVDESKQTLYDTTQHDVSIAMHGYAPKAPGDPNKFLDGTGQYSTPSVVELDDVIIDGGNF